MAPDCQLLVSGELLFEAFYTWPDKFFAREFGVMFLQVGLHNSWLDLTLRKRVGLRVELGLCPRDNQLNAFWCVLVYMFY